MQSGLIFDEQVDPFSIDINTLVMLTWPSRIIRTTRDMDFRAFIDSDLEEVSRTLKEICETAVEADAIRFDAESIRVEVINERATYPGIRARFVGYIDKVEIPIQLDLGFSDEIIPSPKTEQFPTILDFPAPIIYVYPPETSLSEKVEAIFYYGEINSRMNDFYDIWAISNEFQIEGSLLTNLYLKKRGTPMSVGYSYSGFKMPISTARKSEFVEYLIRPNRLEQDNFDSTSVFGHKRKLLLLSFSKDIVIPRKLSLR